MLLLSPSSAIIAVPARSCHEDTRYCRHGVEASQDGDSLSRTKKPIPLVHIMMAYFDQERYYTTLDLSG